MQTGFLTLCTVHVRYLSRSIQVCVATALFLRPKNMGAIIAKHKNDRHVPGNVKSPLSVLALSKVAEKRIESTSCIWKTPFWT